MNGYVRKWQVFGRSDAAKASVCNFPGNDLLFIYRKHRNIVVLSLISDKCYLFRYFWGRVNAFFRQSKTLFFPPFEHEFLSNKTPNTYDSTSIIPTRDFWGADGHTDPLINTIPRDSDFLLIGVVQHVDRVKLLIATVLWRMIRKKSTPHYSHLASPWHSCSSAWLKDN